ncbi:MAG TPA: universal stress protein [Verrucomicrobia bacterium]|nr:universal stress protein [Verrucomicrobiota bacterium]
MKVKTSSRSKKVVLELESGDAGLPPVPVPELRVKQILVPVDFSDASRKALHYAQSLGRQFHSELMILHVIVHVPPPQTLVIETEIFSTEYHEQAAKQLAEWRKDVSGPATVKAVVRQGLSAHHEIVEMARECNSDLIVIGNTGRSGLARMVLGSTAERVVRHAPCPVLVVRDSEHDFLEERADNT